MSQGVQEVLEAVASRATEGRAVDAGAALARAAARRRQSRRRWTLAWLAAAGVVAAVAVVHPLPLGSLTPGSADAQPGASPLPGGPHALGGASGNWVGRAAVVALVLLAVALVVGRVVVRRLRAPRRRQTGTALLVLLGTLPLAAPTLISQEFTRWTHAPVGRPADRFVRLPGLPGAATGPVMPRTIGDQRMVPPPAFDQTGSPRTTRVAAVFRATIAGASGLYGVDAASGGIVRLDTVTGGFGTPLQPQPELAVSPNGRFVATARAGDDRSTGTGVGATVIDLQTATWRGVPLLAPPGQSTGSRTGQVAGPSTGFAVLDDGTLVVVRDGNHALWLYPAGLPVGQRRELTGFGAVTGVNALPGDRFLVWRPDPAKEPRTTTGLAFGDVRVDVVQASTGVVVAFAPQVGFGAETSLYVDPANSVVYVAGIQIQSPLQTVRAGQPPVQAPAPAPDRPSSVLFADVMVARTGLPAMPSIVSAPDMNSGFSLVTLAPTVSRLVVASDGLGQPQVVVRADPWWTAIGALPWWLFTIPALALGLAAALAATRRRRLR